VIGGVFALTPGWGAGSLYAVGLLFVGVVVLVGLAARSHQAERSFSASVFYVAFGALAAVALSLLDVAVVAGSGALSSAEQHTVVWTTLVVVVVSNVVHGLSATPLTRRLLT